MTHYCYCFIVGPVVVACRRGAVQAAGVNLARPWNFFRLEPTFVAFTWVGRC